MDLDQLQSVRDRERQTDKLQQLRDSFYEDATAFVRNLRDERDSAAREAEDPFDAPEVNRLTDRIRTAEQTIEAIYEKRVGKLVKAATFAAADLPAEADGMTAEEEDLFETLVAEIRANRRRVLDRLTGEGDAAGDAGPADLGDGSADGGETSSDAGGVDVGDGSGMSAADVMQGDDAAPSPPGDDPADGPPAGTPDDGTDDVTGDEPDDGTDNGPVANGAEKSTENDDGDAETVREDGGPTDDVERELVRITDDVGAIFGVDEREYELAKDDVVSLPAENARPLLERDAAELL